MVVDEAKRMALVSCDHVAAGPVGVVVDDQDRHVSDSRGVESLETLEQSTKFFRSAIRQDGDADRHDGVMVAVS